MQKFRISLFLIVSLVLSMSVSASVIGEKSYTEPAFVMYAGYSGTEVAVSGQSAEAELAYIITDLESSINGISVRSLDNLKPDKDEPKFTYNVLKPTKLAKIQNQNFDRVKVHYSY